MIANIRLLNENAEVTGDGYARQSVDISQDAPIVTFGPALEDWGIATHIEAHKGGALLYRQTIPQGPVEFSKGATHILSIGSIQFGDAP